MRKPTLAASAAALVWVGPQPPDASLPTKLWKTWADSNEFLLSPDAFLYPLYLVQTRQHGTRGFTLISLLRRGTNAGILALSRRPQADLVAALDAGADLVLQQSAPPEHLLAAVRAVQRRYPLSGTQPVLPSDLPWTLEPASRILLTPNGTRILLSANETLVMHILVRAQAHTVPRGDLLQKLWGAQSVEMNSALTAMIYRLRRRISQGSRWPAPVHAVTNVGYKFRAPLMIA